MKIKKYLKLDTLTEEQIAALKAAGISIEAHRNVLQWQKVSSINGAGVGVYLKTRKGELLYCPVDRLTKYLQRKRIETLINNS